MNARTSILLLITLLPALACGLPGTGPTPSPPTATALPPTSAPTATAVPIQAPTATPTAAQPSDGTGIDIEGPPEFTDQAQAALDLLGSCAPEALVTADQQLEAIVHSDRSGMDVASGAFMASNTTAFAPGYPESAQVFWFAGAIVHDARHRWQSENGMTTNWDAMSLEERQEIEHDARGVQIEALEGCLPEIPQEARTHAQGMLDYLTGMQTGEIPCDYCETEWADRDW